MANKKKAKAAAADSSLDKVTDYRFPEARGTTTMTNNTESTTTTKATAATPGAQDAPKPATDPTHPVSTLRTAWTKVRTNAKVSDSARCDDGLRDQNQDGPVGVFQELRYPDCLPALAYSQMMVSGVGSSPT